MRAGWLCIDVLDDDGVQDVHDDKKNGEDGDPLSVGWQHFGLGFYFKKTCFLLSYFVSKETV